MATVNVSLPKSEEPYFTDPIEVKEPGSIVPIRVEVPAIPELIKGLISLTIYADGGKEPLAPAGRPFFVRGGANGSEAVTHATTLRTAPKYIRLKVECKGIPELGKASTKIAFVVET
jgi:hypothetical protein